MIVAIDPGNEQSAWVRYTGGMPIRAKIEPNEVLLQRLRDGMAGALVIEGIASYGMPVGREVFDTCIWIGRFILFQKRLTPKMMTEPSPVAITRLFMSSRLE